MSILVWTCHVAFTPSGFMEGWKSMLFILSYPFSSLYKTELRWRTSLTRTVQQKPFKTLVTQDIN